MQENRCIICNKTITNPICPNCINKEVEAWLRDRSYAINLVGKEVDYSSLRCIICLNNMDICPHCYTKDVFVVIQEEFPKIVEEFEEVFRL